MTWQLATDRTAAFADAMLEQVKAHLRVEFTRDDDYIRGVIMRAADQVERTTGQALVPSTYVNLETAADAWLDGQTIRSLTHCRACCDYAGAGGTVLPGWLRPIASFRGLVQDLADPTLFEDRSPSWALLTGGPDYLGPQFMAASDAVYSDGWLFGPVTMAWRLEITVGGATATANAGLYDLMLRLCGHLYENRELNVSTGQQLAQDFMPQAFSTLWVPRC